MKKLILAILVTLIAQLSFANCDATSHYYASEDDNTGVDLPLAYSCNSQEAEVCVYLGSGLAKIEGISVSSSDMTRQKINSSGSKLEISLKTGLVSSLLDYRYATLTLNLNSMNGVVTSGGRGISPYDGIITRPEEKLQVQCSLN